MTLPRFAQFVTLFIVLALVFALFGDLTLVYVGVGWAWFIARVMPQMTVSPSGVISAILALALFIYVFHRFMCWLFRIETPDDPGATASTWRFRWTAGITTLILVMFTAGISAVGVVHQIGWIATSPVPMYEGGIRAAASRSKSSNNLKQIALGAHSYAEDRGKNLPPGFTVDAKGRRLHGWPTLMLPYLEYHDLHSRIDLTKPWDSLVNQPAMRRQVTSFLIGGDKQPETDASGYGLIYYAGNSHVFPPVRGLRNPDDFKDGTANTILYGEITEGIRPWGYPIHLRDPALGLGKNANTFGGSWSSRGPLFAFADGSVRSISIHLSPAVLKAAATPAGGEQTEIPSDW